MPTIEEVWYCMRKSGVAERYVRIVGLQLSAKDPLRDINSAE